MITLGSERVAIFQFNSIFQYFNSISIFYDLCHIFFSRDVVHNYVYPSIDNETYALTGSANSSLASFGKSEVLFHLDTLEKRYLTKKKFLCGNSVCFADNWVAVTLSLLELVNMNLESWPKLRQWMDVMKSNVDYVDVSHAHEERIRRNCYNPSTRNSET